MPCGRVLPCAKKSNKPVGVLEGEWSTDELLREMMEKGCRSNEKVIFDPDPAKLVGRVLALVEKEKAQEHRFYCNPPDPKFKRVL